MATDFDITNLYQKWIELDRELRILKQEVSDLKSAQQPKTLKSEWPSLVASIEKLRQQESSPDKPAQWPNEPYTDYLKRIGEYNEAMIYEDESK